MTTFCTYFDRNYLPQGIALYRSLVRTQPTALLWILCLDEETHSVVTSLNLTQARTVSVDDLLAFEQRLVTPRGQRPALEFYYACTPQLIRYVAAQAPGPHGVAYVDADVFFFRDPSTLYAELPDADIILVEHRSGDPKLEAERGRFNLCFTHFAPTLNAVRALEWWCEMTLESTAMDAETWGDQKYLDRFPDLFDSVGILRRPETTLAPWNVWQHAVSRDDSTVRVDGRALVTYHFARLLLIGPHLFSPARREWLSRRVMRWIYRPYIRELRESLAQIKSIVPAYSVSHTGANRRRLILGLLAGRWFYEGDLGIRRLGVYVPNTRKEFRVQAHVARQRLPGNTKARKLLRSEDRG